jgi:hypothetical protein
MVEVVSSGALTRSGGAKNHGQTPEKFLPWRVSGIVFFAQTDGAPVVLDGFRMVLDGFRMVCQWHCSFQ